MIEICKKSPKIIGFLLKSSRRDTIIVNCQLSIVNCQFGEATKFQFIRVLTKANN